ncbi:MAG: acyl-CoA thioesterase [Betaproteobacteria bacterium]
MTETKKLAGISRVPIRWSDMDAYGHVNNSNYFRYAEQGRVEMMDALGIVIRPGGIGPVIINAACTFLAPMSYPGTVEVRTYVGPPGRSSFMTFMEMRLEGDDTLYTEGTAKVVWMDHRTGRSVALPDEIRQWLEGPEFKA